MLYDFHMGRMKNLKEKDIVSLTALALQHDYGDYKGNPTFLDDKYANYVPVDRVDENSLPNWINKVLSS